ncbi:MAG: hypothetical protein IT287_04095, partial [Bdellovibrionaceae bacterium]|nr:hypothetical protein [Pseudobdellovibrionaceae bacterium]
ENGEKSVSTLNWSIPEDLFYFDGHFPQNPVLPAVAIVDISLAFVQKAHPGITVDLLSVVSAKFSQPLRPLSKTLISAKPAVVSAADQEGYFWDVEWKDIESLDVAAQLRLSVLFR